MQTLVVDFLFVDDVSTSEVRDSRGDQHANQETGEGLFVQACRSPSGRRDEDSLIADQ
ncbi:hypothetical protein KFU94_66335 [Chloroflexi bacterium TSY]|nr:hypothetical protein [Chloroflexi bacterium TSY]